VLVLAAEGVPKLCPNPAHSGALQITPAHTARRGFVFHLKHSRALARTGGQD